MLLRLFISQRYLLGLLAVVPCCGFLVNCTVFSRSSTFGKLGFANESGVGWIIGGPAAAVCSVVYFFSLLIWLPAKTGQLVWTSICICMLPCLIHYQGVYKIYVIRVLLNCRAMGPFVEPS